MISESYDRKGVIDRFDDVPVRNTTLKGNEYALAQEIIDSD